MTTESSQFAPFRKTINPLKCLPFLIAHAGCLLALWTGVSALALLVCVVLYVVRAFGLTAGYHRYFSHHSFKTGRGFQFFLALLGASAAQNGPLWWAAHHRAHHGTTDRDGDVHSPVIHGFWWAHVGWIMSGLFRRTEETRVKDWMKYGELRWINRHHYLIPIGLAGALYGLGEWLRVGAPALGTNGLQMLAWGFFISTVTLYHTTFATNSVSHLWGRRRYETADHSRNNAILAILTLGEGWHNNHHRYPNCERQGFARWEIDVTHYAIVALSWLGLVWDVRHPPGPVLAEGGIPQ